MNKDVLNTLTMKAYIGKKREDRTTKMNPDNTINVRITKKKYKKKSERTT